MLQSPLTIFWLLLVGGAILLALARFRFRFVHETAVIVVALAFLLWFLLRNQLPVVVMLSDWPAGTGQIAWTIRVDEMAWQLSGALLLLLVVSLVVSWNATLDQVPDEDGAWQRNAPILSLTLFASAAGLIALWSDSPVGLIMAWMTLIVTWAGLDLVATQPEKRDTGSLLRRAGWLLLSVFFLWLAAATAPDRMSNTLVLSDWPRIPTSSLLTAAMLQMGIWPFHGWRPRRGQKAALPEAILHVVPVLPGAMLMLRLVTFSDVSIGYMLFLTVFGLLGLFLGVQRAVTSLFRPVGVAAGAALAQTSLALLAGIWVGGEALLAETMIMVFSSGVLFLLSLRPPIQDRWWYQVGPFVALASMAGLPLTPGFASRSALFSTWLQGGQITLVIVTVLIYMPLVAAVVIQVQDQNQSASAHTPSEPARLRRMKVVHTVGLLLLVVGLVLTVGISLGKGSFGSWLAVLASSAGGLLIYGYRDRLHDPRTTLKEALDMNLPTDMIQRTWQAIARQVGISVQDAATILEGEGGILWLLVVAIIFLLVQMG